VGRGHTHDVSIPPSQPPGPTVRVPLDQDERAASQARRATRDVLAAWRLPALVDAVVVAVSELVTNAVRHGRPHVQLELERGQHRVGVRVHDDEPTEPEVLHGQTVAAGAESGRGLSIVTTLADEVGVEQVPEDGKVVYAYFDTTGREPEDEDA